jgi:hypothetical protein
VCACGLCQRAFMAHLVVEHTWETVSHAVRAAQTRLLAASEMTPAGLQVCAKAEELDAAALVIGSSGKNWVRAACGGGGAGCRARAHYCVPSVCQVYTFGRAQPPQPPKRGLESVRAYPAMRAPAAAR